ncbi:NRDE family protein [Halostagnicola bangensis]
MCTLTLAWQVFDDAPVAVAANRDEALERPSTLPNIYHEEPLVVAPRDTEAGGTWIGYNEHGVFAGITNRWTDADLAGDRSRGLLVGDVLEAESAVEAARTIETVTDKHEYSGFNLTVADAERAYCYTWDGELDRLEFDPGVHVVVNVAVDDAVAIPSVRPELARVQASNARAVREELEVDPGELADEWLERAGDVLGDHEYGVCIHRDGFGTRSSSLIALGETTTYEFADGPPCRTAYEELSSVGDLEGHI